MLIIFILTIISSAFILRLIGVRSLPILIDHFKIVPSPLFEGVVAMEIESNPHPPAPQAISGGICLSQKVHPSVCISAGGPYL